VIGFGARWVVWVGEGAVEWWEEGLVLGRREVRLRSPCKIGFTLAISV